MSGRPALALCLLLALASSALCLPEYFASKYANGCEDHPERSYGDHAAPQIDRDTTIALKPKFTLPAGAASPKKLCPGASYSLKVTFPSPRLALLTASAGSLAGAPEASCPNRLITPGRSPFATWEDELRVPCNSPGEIKLRVTSTQSAIGGYRVATVTVAVAGTDGACAPVSSYCVKGGKPAAAATPPVVTPTGLPVTQFNAASSTSNIADSIDGMSSQASRLAQPPVYAMRPVLKSSKGLWQFLHALLMLLSFGVMLPLGMMAARHKWIFGSNEETGKVSPAWFYVHIVLQLGGVVSGLGGFAIALLAFGWKQVPGQALYQPHKWMGIVVLVMALLQVLVAPCRPKATSNARSCWNSMHWGWGRLTMLAGAANLVLGALLVHGYKGQPYVGWLLACCLVLGVLALLALLLEAFKLQMQRTLRYDPTTGTLLPVMHGVKRSTRRTDGQAQLLPGFPRSDSPAAGAPLPLGKAPVSVPPLQDGPAYPPIPSYKPGMPLAAAADMDADSLSNYDQQPRPLPRT
ncbi:hypothetical protein OEZ86_002934 [Tetradesmus obliquus]|nr:hypothetical protein OEZ86_002934 [Tetradesmus obliquus]